MIRLSNNDSYRIAYDVKYLYEQIWTQPLEKVGEYYYLTETAIRKLCDEYGIPRPDRKQRSEINRGIPVQIPKLPESVPRIIVKERHLDGDKRDYRHEEIRKLNAIIDDAELYQTAEALRAYADRLGKEGCSAEEIDWIRKKADWMDPFVNAHDSVFGDRKQIVIHNYKYDYKL